MARGTVLAEILLEGERTFQRGVENAGDQMDDAGRDATTLAGALGLAESGLEDVRGSALGAAFGLGRVAAQADDAGDELIETGAQATTTSGLFGTLSVGTFGLSASLGTLSTTIVAVAVPALVALSTTLVPLTATLTGVAAAAGGLAGAFGAVVGSGALAYGQELSDEYQTQLLRVEDQIAALEDLRDEQGSLTDAQRKELQQLKTRKQELDDVEGAMSALEVKLGDVAEEVGGIVAEWGANFAPLIRDAINAIPSLVRSVLDAVGNLSDFRDVLRQLGGEAARSLPALASTLVRVGREALPVLVDGFQWLRQNGARVFDGILQTTRTVAPLIADVGGAFADALPSINRFGTAVLQDVLPALADGTRGFGDLLDQILAFTQTQQFAEIIDAARAAVVELSPELSELSDNAGRLFEALVENGPQIIRGFTAIADSVLDIVNALTPVLELFLDIVGAVAGAFAGFTERSERQEQNLADQGVLGYLGGGASDLLGNPSTTASGGLAARRLEARTGEAREVVVRVESDDEKFETFVDERVTESERQRARRVRRSQPP